MSKYLKINEIAFFVLLSLLTLDVVMWGLFTLVRGFKMINFEMYSEVVGAVSILMIILCVLLLVSLVLLLKKDQ